MRKHVSCCIRFLLCVRLLVYTRYSCVSFESCCAMLSSTNAATAPSCSPPHIKTETYSVQSVESGSLAREDCKELCGGHGFPFYGLGWSIVCYCGGKETTKSKLSFIEMLNEYQVDDELCDLPCPGADTVDTCGGKGFIEIGEV